MYLFHTLTSVGRENRYRKAKECSRFFVQYAIQAAFLIRNLAHGLLVNVS